MTTKKEFAYLVGGVGLGIYVPKLVPKLKTVKAVKYYKEVVSAWFRLKKIVIEEYNRIDEAIQTEETFLKMINPNIKSTSMQVSFEVQDDGKDRDIKLNFGKTKDQ